MKTISNKTAVTGLSGTAVVLLVYLVGLFGVELPAEIAAAVVTLVTALIGYLLPAKSGRYVATNQIGDEEHSDPESYGVEYEEVPE